MTPEPRKRVDYTAPIGCLDSPALDQGPVWPCHDCLPWHVEVVTGPGDTIVLREWHAVDCPTFAAALAVDEE